MKIPVLNHVKPPVKISHPELKDTLDSLCSFFGDITQESKLGSELVGLDLSTDFTESVKEAMSNPFEHTFKVLKFNEKILVQVIDIGFINFFKKNKNLIEKVVNPYKNNPLFYTIVLKNDTTKNRAKFLTFLESWNDTHYRSNFPVTFYFVPKQFQDGIKNSKEITL